MSKQKEIAAKLEGASGDQGKAVCFFRFKYISHYTFFCSRNAGAGVCCLYC